VQLNDAVVTAVLLLAVQIPQRIPNVVVFKGLPADALLLLLRRIDLELIKPLKKERRQLYKNFYLFLGPGAPESVIDGGVFEQGSKDKDEAHDQIDVDGFDVTDARQGRSNARRYGRHGQHGRDSFSESQS
jgi:hypothetical protein